jgi:hypothetical protein
VDGLDFYDALNWLNGNDQDSIAELGRSLKVRVAGSNLVSALEKATDEPG